MELEQKTVKVGHFSITFHAPRARMELSRGQMQVLKDEKSKVVEFFLKTFNLDLRTFIDDEEVVPEEELESSEIEYFNKNFIHQEFANDRSLNPFQKYIIVNSQKVQTAAARSDFAVLETFYGEQSTDLYLYFGFINKEGRAMPYDWSDGFVKLGDVERLDLRIQTS